MNEIERLADQLERLLGDDKHEVDVSLPSGRILKILRLRQGERPEITAQSGGN